MAEIVAKSGLSHIALHIFSFLRFDTNDNGNTFSMDDINNCRLVCKAWQEVIDTSLLYWRKRLSFQTMKKWRTTNHWEEFDWAFDLARFSRRYRNTEDVRDFALLFEQYLDEVEWEETSEFDPLYYFCQQGNVEAVALFLKFYEDLDCKAETQMTSLMAACSLGQTDIVNLFLDINMEEHDIDYNMRDAQNHTALLYASRKGHTDIVKLMFEKSEERQIDLDVVCDKNMNVFGWAIWSRNDDLLDFLINSLDKYSIATDGLIHGFDIRGGSLFTLACWRKNLKAVSYFLDNSEELGIDLNQKDQGGRSGLFIACLNGCVEIVKLLAENVTSKGINIEDTSTTTNFNSNALIIAARFNRVTVVEYILSHLQMFKCNVHDVNVNERTAFLAACSEDNIDAAKVMLDSLDPEEKKSMLTYQDYHGHNALMLTIIYRHRRNRPYKTMRYLLEQMMMLGIPLCDRNKNGGGPISAMTVFDLICTLGDVHVLWHYIKFVENHVDYADHNGETGFIKACKNNRHDIVQQIIWAKGTRIFTLDLNATDNEWMTGFMWACKLRCAKVVEVILKYASLCSIDLIANDKQGRTGFDLWPKKIPFPTTEEYQQKRHIYCNLGPNFYDRYLGVE